MGNLYWNGTSFKTTKRFNFENTVWTAKILLISVGVVASLVLFRITIIPYASVFLISTLPCFWGSLKGLFSPPYIYIIANFIILVIATSSTFQHPNHQTKERKKTTITNNLHRRFSGSNLVDPTQFDSVSVYQDKNLDVDYHIEATNDNQSGEVWLEKDEMENPVVVTPIGKGREVLNSLKEETGSGNVSLDSFGTFPRENESNEVENKHSGKERAELEVGNLDVPKEPGDTLDSIWRAIMEGQGKPSALHPTASDTWNGHPKLARADPEMGVDPVAWARGEMRKSETFKESNSTVSSPRREKVMMSQDELKQRAEAFIKKFTNDMRLQREQSNQRDLELLNRGKH